MALDASIYGQLKQADVPTFGEMQQRAFSVQNLAAQGRKAEQDAANASREAGMQKLSIIGNAMQSLSGLSPQARAQAYPQVRSQLINAGALKPEEAPEQHDENFYQTALRQYQQGMDYAKQQQMQAQTGLTNAQAQAMRNESRNLKKTLTPGQEKIDEAFGKDIAEYQYGGGKEQLQSNLGRLQGAANELAANPDLTGGITTKIPLLSSETAQNLINPKMAKVRDDIRGAVQGSLRQVLGAQFTQKEGDAIFNRAFNPQLSAEENLRRAQGEIDKLRAMGSQKDKALAYFKENGTLRGFEPGATDLTGGQTAVATAPRKGGGMISDAVAGGMPKAPAGTLLMQAPDGSLRFVPVAQKGEAIAAGGKVVK